MSESFIGVKNPYKPTLMWHAKENYLRAWNMTSIAGTTALATLFFIAFSIASYEELEFITVLRSHLQRGIAFKRILYH